MRPSLLAIVVVLLGFSTHAEGDGAAIQKAQRYFRQGDVAYRLGDFSKALGHYRQALALVQRPSIVLNIAQCYRQLGQRQEALFYYRLYLSDWQRANPNTPPPYQDEVQAHIAALTAPTVEAPVPEARPEPPPSPEPGAAPTGGPAPTPGSAPPVAGATAPTPGSAPPVAGATAPPRPTPSSSLRLDDGAAASDLGSLELRGLLDGTEIFVDGAHVATAPLDEPLVLLPGTHGLRLARQGFVPWEKNLLLRPSEQQTLEVSQEQSRLWLLLSVGAVVLGLGAEGAAIGLTMQARDEYQGLPDWERYRDGALASHIVAGVFGAAALSFLAVHLVHGHLIKTPAPGDRAGSSGAARTLMRALQDGYVSF